VTATVSVSCKAGSQEGVMKVVIVGRMGQGWRGSTPPDTESEVSRRKWNPGGC
jgi:hypothetical protein